MMHNTLSRVWFLNQGCKQVPLDASRGIVRWAHPDGYFLRSNGTKIPNDNVNPATTKERHPGGSVYPKDRATNKLMHILMALAFYGPRPTFKDKNGKPYVGICHHLIPDKLDYRPANLLCWLTRAEHAEADSRQRALKKVVPNGDLHLFSYERLRYLQDPRTTSREIFETELARIAEKNYHFSTPKE